MGGVPVCGAVTGASADAFTINAKGNSMSFVLEVTFAGLVLVEQIDAGAYSGTYILLPTYHHSHTVSLLISGKPIEFTGHFDCYYTGGRVAQVENVAKLSKILGDQDQVVERDGSGKPTSALVASLRLPLPKGVIAGVDDFVELDFKFVTATQTGPFTVAGAGTFEVEILADSISFGPLTFTPTNNRLAMKVQNMPDHETEWPDEGHVFTGHHMDVMYPLLSGKPSAPTVRITGRPKFDAVGAATSVWRRGVDPAQCTPAVV